MALDYFLFLSDVDLTVVSLISKTEDWGEPLLGYFLPRICGSVGFGECMQNSLLTEWNLWPGRDLAKL